jgi:nucleoid-associated protein YgaU
MMDRGVKLILAASIILGGAAVALLFRHEGPQREPTLSAASDRLVLRDRAAPGEGLAPPLSSTKPVGTAEGAPKSPQRLAAEELRGSSTIVAPVKPETRGDLPRTPATADDADPHWGTSMNLGVPSGKVAAKPRRHKIADGDTLAGLAERYLGSRDRYLEIFEANRDVLSSPELLPIGVTLKIPPIEGMAPPAKPKP